jgi:branched-chain amino acid transport system substrate-binding protein
MILRMLKSLCALLWVLVAANAAGAPRHPAPRQARVGVVLSATGAGSIYGVSSRRGVELAVDAVNAAAGPSDPLVAPVYLDDASDTDTGLKAFKKASRSDKALLILGPTLSVVAFATDPLAQKDGVPVLGISNTAPGLTAIGVFVFRDSLTDAVVIPRVVNVVHAATGFSSAALVMQSGDPYALGAAQAFRDAAVAEGIPILTEQTFAKGDTDFTAQLTAVQNASPGAVFLAAFAGDAGALVKQARDLGIGAGTLMLGGNGINSPAFLSAAGPAAEGAYIGAAWNAALADAGSQAFVAAFAARFGSAPDQYAAQAYAGVQIASAAISSAGTVEDRGAVRDALAAIHDLPTVLGPFSFTADREAEIEPVVQIVQGGAFTVFP